MARSKLFIREVINTHEQLVCAKVGKIPPYAIVKMMGGARRDYVSGVGVYSSDGPTDPEAHFLDNGIKVFRLILQEGNTHHERRRAAEEKAKAWVLERYGVKDWERNRWGDLVPSPVNQMFPLRK